MKIFINLLLITVIITGCVNTEKQLSRKAARIHSSILTVDSHCDTPMGFSEPGFDMGVRSADGCVDFPKMVEGGLHAEFFVVFTEQGPRNDSSYNQVHLKALQIISEIRNNVEKNSSMAEIATTPDDACRLKKAHKIAAYIGMENGYPIGKDISR